MPDPHLRSMPVNEIVLNSDDLIRHPRKYNPRDRSCCGYRGLVGFNVYCTKGHPVGTEISDCCTVNFAHLPLDRVTASQPDPGGPASPQRPWWRLW